MKSKFSWLVTIAIAASSLVFVSPAAGTLISKFQAQSPVSIYIPANQPVPAQGSTVTFSYDRADFTGNQADQNYTAALAVGTTATVTKVIADLGYTAYPNVGTIATAGDLGYLVLLDFGQNPDFTYAYVGYASFASAATQIDAAGAAGAYSYTDSGTTYVWLPASVNASGVTGVIDAWAFQTITSVSASTSNHVLDCSKLQSSGPSSPTACLANLPTVQARTGTLLTLSSGPTSGHLFDDFVGLVGATSQIQGGLVQTSIVQGPGVSQTSNQASAPRYAGPEFSSFGAPVLAGDKLVSQGKRLDGITSLKINGSAATYKINSASELEIDVPKDLAPGKYDIEITSTHGKLTHLQAFTVKAVVPTKTLEFKGDGRTLGYDELLELTKMAKQIGAEYTSVKCIVNAADSAVAKRLVSRGCDYVGAVRLRGKEVSTEAKSTYKGDGFWFKIVANG